MKTQTLNAAYVLLQLQQFYTNTSLLNAVRKAHRANLTHTKLLWHCLLVCEVLDKIILCHTRLVGVSWKGLLEDGVHLEIKLHNNARHDVWRAAKFFRCRSQRISQVILYILYWVELCLRSCVHEILPHPWA